MLHFGEIPPESQYFRDWGSFKYDKTPLLKNIRTGTIQDTHPGQPVRFLLALAIFSCPVPSFLATPDDGDELLAYRPIG
jgi:hypothetical protein